jgi:hypothetical protein
MDDAVGVRVVERGPDLARDAGHAPRLQRSGAQRSRERLALHVLHHDQDALVVDGGVEHGHEVRVVERSAELRLAQEALLHVVRAVGVEALDGDLAAEPLVLTQQDVRHPAQAEWPQHPITPVQKCPVGGDRHPNQVPARDAG